MVQLFHLKTMETCPFTCKTWNDGRFRGSRTGVQRWVLSPSLKAVCHMLFNPCFSNSRISYTRANRVCDVCNVGRDIRTTNAVCRLIDKLGCRESTGCCQCTIFLAQAHVPRYHPSKNSRMWESPWDIKYATYTPAHASTNDSDKFVRIRTNGDRGKKMTATGIVCERRDMSYFSRTIRSQRASSVQVSRRNL